MAPSLVPDSALRTEGDGRLLLGGHPFRVLRLSATGAGRMRAWFAGDATPTGQTETQLAARLVEAGLAHPRPAPVRHRCHIVIPFKGALAELETTLSSLRSSDPASITVVDDGCEPPVPPFDGVTVLRHDASTGPAAARNTGWRHVMHHFDGATAVDDAAEVDVDGADRRSPCDLVVFVDAGVVAPAPNDRDGATWLDHLTGHFSDPAVAAVAPRVASVPGSTALERYEALFSPLDLGPGPSLVGPDRRTTYVPTACLVTSLETLMSTDGFDPALRFGEDVDFVWRVSENKQVRYDPSVIVHHHPRASIRAFAEQRFRYASAAAPLDERHPRASAPWRSSLVGVAGVALLSFARPFAGALVGFAPTHLLAGQLATTATPTATAIRLLAQSHRWALMSFAECAARSWSGGGLALVALPRGRRTALAWMCAGWARRLQVTRSPALLGLGVVDDVAYGAGALAGAVEQRSLRSLLPSISRWG